MIYFHKYQANSIYGFFLFRPCTVLSCFCWLARKVTGLLKVMGWIMDSSAQLIYLKWSRLPNQKALMKWLVVDYQLALDPIILHQISNQVISICQANKYLTLYKSDASTKLEIMCCLTCVQISFGDRHCSVIAISFISSYESIRETKKGKFTLNYTIKIFG